MINDIHNLQLQQARLSIQSSVQERSKSSCIQQLRIIQGCHGKRKTENLVLEFFQTGNLTKIFKKEYFHTGKLP